MVDSSYNIKTSGMSEMYISDTPLDFGDIVVIGGDLDVTPCVKNHDPRILGVFGSPSSLQMNTELNLGNPITIAGRTMANIQGPIDQGDLIVTSDTAGVGQKLDSKKYVVGCILGKSLNSIEDDSIQLIEIVVGIK